MLNVLPDVRSNPITTLLRLQACEKIPIAAPIDKYPPILGRRTHDQGKIIPSLLLSPKDPRHPREAMDVEESPWADTNQPSQASSKDDEEAPATSQATSQAASTSSAPRPQRGPRRMVAQPTRLEAVDDPLGPLGAAPRPKTMPRPPRRHLRRRSKWWCARRCHLNNRNYQPIRNLWERKTPMRNRVEDERLRRLKLLGPAV